MSYGVPSPPTPRARRREATIERILEEAMAIVVAEGFAALSIHRLARELDYTPGALYRYFRSKDVLIAALTTRVLRAFGAAVSETVDSQPADAPLRRIRAGIGAYRELARSAPHRFGLLSMLLAEPRLLISSPEAAAPAIDAMVAAMMPLAESFARAAVLGQLAPGDARQRTLVAFCAVHGVLQLRKQELRAPGLIDLDLLCDSAIHTLLVGWGASPEAASPRPISG